MIKMEISKENKKLLKRLLDTKETNMNVADILLYVFQNEIHPFKNEIDYIIKEKKVNETQALYIWLMDRLELNLDYDENLRLCNKYFLANINKEEIKKYMENPYVKAISNINIVDKNYSLKMLSYAPYQLFPLNDFYIDDKDFFAELTPLGYFDKKYTYLALLQKRRIWMSLNPNEINTMEPHIARAKGNILVLGLGLGYFPYMCSLKKEVKSITIIERDPKIIELFENNLLPIFPNKNRIKIICEDAISFLSDKHDFDYIFADLWHDALDGLEMYLMLKNLEIGYQLNMSYWLENSFGALLRRIALSVLNNEKELLKDSPIDKIHQLYESRIKGDNLLSDLSSDNLLDLLINKKAFAKP